MTTVKVCVVGDVHANVKFLSSVFAAVDADRDRYPSAELGCNTVIQLGDFNLSLKQEIIDVVREWLNVDERRKFYWVDGNHDHHDFIEETILSTVNKISDAPVSYWHERMYYCPRGSLATIGNSKVMFIGGAYSVDKSRRTAHVSWFPRETISARDVYQALSYTGPLDVMFTHDSPDNPGLDAYLEEHSYKLDYHSGENRRNLSRLVDELRPKLLCHGHYHYRYSSIYQSPQAYKTIIEGIGRDWPKAICDENYLYLEL